MHASETSLDPVYVRVELDSRKNPNDPEGADISRVLATPDPFRIRPGQPLVFVSRLPFAVHFVDDAPLRGPLVDLSEGTPEDWGCEVDCPDRYCYGQLARSDSARPRRYKYTVSVARGEQVYIADPEGVVDPDPPGTGSIT